MASSTQQQQPSCVIEEIVDEPDPAEHDPALGRILTKCEGDASRLLKAVFGFLGRKSNFYKEGDAHARVLEALKQARRAARGRGRSVQQFKLVHPGRRRAARPAWAGSSCLREDRALEWARGRARPPCPAIA